MKLVQWSLWCCCI